MDSRDALPSDRFPYGNRIIELSPEEKVIIAQHRFEEFDKLLKLAGCATQPDPKSLAINFHTGTHMMIVQVDRDDPRQIGLHMIFRKAEGDIDKAHWACYEASRQHFASKAVAMPIGEGFQVTISVGVYAEIAHSFGDNLEAYVDDIAGLYQSFIGLMVSE